MRQDCVCGGRNKTSLACLGSCLVLWTLNNVYEQDTHNAHGLRSVGMQLRALLLPSLITHLLYARQTSTHGHHTAAHCCRCLPQPESRHLQKGNTTERGCKVLIINEYNTNGESSLLFTCDVETYTLQTHATHHKRTGYLGDRSKGT